MERRPHQRLAACLVALAACARAPSRARTVTRRPAPAPAVSLWSLSPAPRSWPGVRDVAALGDGAAVIAGPWGLARIEPGGSAPACGEADLSVDGGPSQVIAVDRRVIAVAHRAATHLWVSTDGARSCAHDAVPEVTADPGAELRVAALGEVAVVWPVSVVGTPQRRGASGPWTALPVIEGATDAALTSEGMVALVATRDPRRAVTQTRLRWLRWGASSWVDAGFVGSARAALGRRDGALRVVDDDAERALSSRDGALVVGAPTPLPRDEERARWIETSVGLAALGRRSIEALDAGATPATTPVEVDVLTALDLSTDGDAWVSDGERVWARRGGRWRLAATSVAANGAVSLRVAGARAAIVGAGQGIVIARVGPSGWSVENDLATSEVRSVAIGEEGAVTALYDYRFAAGERELHPVTVPVGVMEVNSAGREVWQLGDRWLVLRQGALWSSDDRGARWTRRDPGSRDLGPLDLARTPVLAGAFVSDGRGVLIDSAANLWRTDDAGSTFRALGGPRATPASTRDAMRFGARMYWRGGDEVWIAPTHGHVLFSVAAELKPIATPATARFVALSDRGGVLAALDARESPERCDARGAALYALGPDGWTAIPDACAHVGLAFAQDGDTLWRLAADLSLERASVSALLTRTVGTDARVSARDEDAGATP
ncbi:MAG: hypothetical protein R3A52_20675 [Polyangiales bacterium]